MRKVPVLNNEKCGGMKKKKRRRQIENERNAKKDRNLGKFLQSKKFRYFVRDLSGLPSGRRSVY